MILLHGYKWFNLYEILEVPHLEDEGYLCQLLQNVLCYKGSLEPSKVTCDSLASLQFKASFGPIYLLNRAQWRILWIFKGQAHVDRLTQQ